MIICGNCHATQLQGTVFCSECGATLGSAAPRTPAAPRAPSTLPTHRTTPITPTSEPRLALLVLHNGHRLTVNGSAPALIGRRDDERGLFPEVDLGGEGGYDAGVSRKHAMIALRHGTYYVEDLGSSNGTFVNGQPVVAPKAAVLADGDELRCGMLKLRVEVKS